MGLFAKERGKDLSDRVVASAKSWLCYEGIDRRSAFLPLGDLETKISPLEVCSKLLSQLKESWNQRHQEFPFDRQTILITVPASFDPSARQLVEEAAQKAGFPKITLIEEPLAAFYAWLHTNEANWRQQLKVGDSVLVVDCGGGTTDFSLILVEEAFGELTLTRKAVGDHLLLGGDNMDLTLAHYVQRKMETSLDDWQFQSLIHACRQAKETLLSEKAPENTEVTIHGRGSSLIGGTLSCLLEKKEIEALLVEGFFSNVSSEENIVQEKRSGLSQLGLPYARDPRITAQLAAFLRKAGCGFPAAVLFNGGTMKAAPFRKRVLELLSKWKGNEVKELPNADYDFAVGKGAAYYGWTRLGRGIRVRAGTSRSYYIGIEGAAPAVPGVSPPLKAVCLAPFGMEEGSEVALNEHFSLLLDEPAAFRFFSLSQPALSNGEAPITGSVVKNWRQELKELLPIETYMHSQGEEGHYVEVTLTAKVTEMGMLELWCTSKNGNRWKLEFDTRTPA